MKKVFFSLFAAWSLLIGSVTMVEAAKNNDEFTVCFRENTLVVASTGLQEARIYDMDGKLQQKKQGTFCEFELEQGTYRLYAKVNGEILRRKVILK